MISQIPVDWLWGLALIAVLLSLAVLPTFIAIVRGADELMLIILVNALCATVLGWPVALIMAIKWPPKHPRPPQGRILPSSQPQSTPYDQTTGPPHTPI